MEFSDIYATAANSHIDSLVNYVLDVKPYHTKLSEIVEEFLLEDAFSVKVTDSHKSMTVMGLDYLNKSGSTSRAVWDGITPRPASTLSAIRTIISDGTRKIFSISPLALPKFLSHSGQEQFVSGQDEYEIYGIKGFSQRKWDGPGIAQVQIDDIFQTESVDYHISHGAFSFDTLSNSRWIETNLAQTSGAPQKSGELLYADVFKPYGTIKNINGTTYEQWTITCIDANNRILEVVGGISGNIGTATFGQFTSTQLSFEFSAVLGENPATQPVISIGDSFSLTPSAKITVHPAAPQETWTIIKTNPQALTSRPVFTRASQAFSGPSISIYTRSLEWTPQSAWTITFNNPQQYTISSTAAGYSPVVVQLIDGCSYKDDYIAFTIVPDETGFIAGDKFEFQVKSPQTKFNYLVHGSVTGWAAPAKIGQWYWNGRIGFKVPPLEYYAVKQSLTISTGTNGSSWGSVSNSQTQTTQQYLNNAAISAGINQLVGASLDELPWSNDATGLTVLNQTNIVIGRGGKIALSADAYSWTSTSTNTTSDLLDVIAVPAGTLTGQTSNIAIAIGHNGEILTSDSGIWWVARLSGSNAVLNSGAFGNNRVVVVGNSGTILFSTNQSTWTPAVSTSVSSALNKIKYINNTFIAVGDNGTIMTSSNGNFWSVKSSGTASRLNDIAFGNGIYVAVGEGATCISTDLDSWQVIASATFNAITFSSGMFVTLQTNRAQIANFIPHRDVHSVAEPSVYTITFRTPVPPNSASDVISATVQNNIYGVRRGLRLSSPNSASYIWEDEFCKWQIGESADGRYKNGEVISVYLAPFASYWARAAYDQLPYDTTPYDSQISEIRFANGPLQEYFPLTHSHGVVIFANQLTNGRIVKIDKADFEHIGLRIGNGVTQIASLGTNNGWVPLEFRVRDRGNSPAWFSDYANYVDAYLGSDPEVLAFTIKQIRYKTTNRPSTAILTFSDSFFNKYLPAGQELSLQFLQTDSFAQRIRVKMSESVSSNIELQQDESPSTDLGTVFAENLTVVERASSVTTRINAVYNAAIHSPPAGAGLYFAQQAPEYIVTHNLSTNTPTVTVSSATGTFTVTPDFTPYFPIPTATSTKSFSLSVPGGTAPFSIVLS